MSCGVQFVLTRNVFLLFLEQKPVPMQNVLDPVAVACVKRWENANLNMSLTIPGFFFIFDLDISVKLELICADC